MVRTISISLLIALLSACTDDNEHFCARYDYLYEQLVSEPDLPSYAEMKLSLQQEIAQKSNDQSKIMLFVLEDFYIGLKPEGEEAFDTCMRLKRWQSYQ